MWEFAISDLTGKLNKTKDELQKAKKGLKQAKTGLQKAKADQEEADDRAYLCEQMANVAIDKIKVGVDA